MKSFPKMKLKYSFEIVEMGDEVIAVAIGDGADDFHGVIKLKNDSAKFIFEHLCSGIDTEEMIKKCQEEYNDSNDEETEEQVISFFETLNNEGLLIEA